MITKEGVASVVGSVKTYYSSERIIVGEKWYMRLNTQSKDMCSIYIQFERNGWI